MKGGDRFCSYCGDGPVIESMGIPKNSFCGKCGKRMGTQQHVVVTDVDIRYITLVKLLFKLMCAVPFALLGIAVVLALLGALCGVRPPHLP